MADQSEKELAAVFDLPKISLRKTDPTLDRSNALKGLVAAVGRAEAAGELKGGNPNQIATDVCITLRYLTGGLLASGIPGRILAPKCHQTQQIPRQVWADALDAWSQQLAQQIVQEHTSQALTPANVQASLQLLLRRDAGHCRRATRLRSQRNGGIIM